MNSKNIYLMLLVTTLLVLGVVFNFRIGKPTQPIIQDNQKPQETEQKTTILYTKTLLYYK